MSRCRALAALLALALALPSAAFAQGAGDEQYQDPFGDEQAQGENRGGAAQDDGLSPEPPVDGDGNGDDGDGAPTPGEPEEPTPAPEEPALPNTGSDPRVLAYVGLLFVLLGVGLRLRTVDPDDF
jgi:LPXTG-motif cell wall-anchored protein